MAQTIREKAKIRQNREEDRPSEDDIAREHLGPRGQKGVPDTATMTEDSKLQTPLAARSRTHDLTHGTASAPGAFFAAALIGKEKPRRGGVGVLNKLEGP